MRDIHPRGIQYYRNQNGSAPFIEWLEAIYDSKTQMGIVPEELSDALSDEAVPRLDTFIGILTALGYRLSIAPLAQVDSSVEIANAEPPIGQLGHSPSGTKVAPTEHQ